MPRLKTPKGFLLSTAGADIKEPRRDIKEPERDDLALILSEEEANVAATFTTNKIKGEPVKLNIRRIRRGTGRAVVINSGNANVCTGRNGAGDALEMSSIAARALGIPEETVFVCSTGIIGVRLPMGRMRPRIKKLARDAGGATLMDAARAIMTTDRFPKLATRTVTAGGKKGTIAAICKGAGMIEPKMATMLCFIMTDLAVQKGSLKRVLKEAVGKSFNRLTVDGCTSTSDTVIIMANGALGNTELKEGSRGFLAFKHAVEDITLKLARMVARDGEGATKAVQVVIKGARTAAEAERAARAVANSNLVKTALYGADPNWGRLMAQLGGSGIEIDAEKTDIYFGPVKVARNGLSTGKNKEARRALNKNDVTVTIDLKLGRHTASVLTCDLTEDYVRVNSEYTT